MKPSRWLAVRAICCACLLGLWPATAEEPAVQVERLRQLLARVEGEPLAVIATLDAEVLLDHLTKTAAGRAFNDPLYAPNRREAMRLLEEQLGAHPEVAWDALRRHLAGPLALVLTSPAAGAANDAPPLRLALLAAVKNEGSIEGIKLGWPSVPPDANRLLGMMALKLHPLEELAKQLPVPAWADRCARMNGEMQILMYPRAALKALRVLSAENAKTPSWMKAFKDLCEDDVERLELNILPLGRIFVEELRCELAPDAKGLLARVLRSLRSDPQPWDALGGALPGGQDVQLLWQMDLKSLGADLPALMQYFERTLRGRRWTNLYGDSDEAMAPQRFAFLVRPWAGTFGLAARQGPTGETEITGVAAEPGAKAEERRDALASGLNELGLAFESSVQAPTIGEHAPLAAAFKGRGIMPAPMIGLSDGWTWLCSSTVAYHDLVSALAEGRSLTKDRRIFSEQWPPKPDQGILFPEKSAFSLQMNLPRIGPLAYTSWMLSDSGQHLFGRQVPAGLLPSPGFLKKHLGPFEAAAVRTEQEVRFYARGPAPGGAALPLMGLAGMVHEIRQMQASGKEAVRKELESLVRPDGTPAQGERK